MSAPVTATRGFLFWAGIGFMVASFALYPLYGMIAWLPVSAYAKTALAAGGWGVSWGLFFAGSWLAGKEGVEILQSRLDRVRFRPRKRE